MKFFQKIIFCEIKKDEKTCEKDDAQLSMDHICIDGKEEEITSTVSPIDRVNSEKIAIS